MKTKKINLSFPVGCGFRLGWVATIVVLVSYSHLLLSNSFSVGNKKTDPVLKEQTRQWIQAQPVRFLENKGQMTDTEGNPVPFVLFKAGAPGMNMYITEKGITYLFVKPEEEESSGQAEVKHDDRNTKTEWERIDMELRGSAIKKENTITETASVTDFNFFLSHCPEGIYGVKEYEKITIKEIYPGIDWVLYNTHEQGFKYDFIVHPGADPKQIELIYSSLNPLTLNKEGGIEIQTKLGTLTENVPVSFYEGKDIKTLFTQNYQKPITIHGGHGYETSVSFSLGTWDLGLRTSDLIIDPQLVWATFYGGADPNSVDGPTSIATDLAGNVFVTGYTGGPNFPVLNPGGGAYFQGIVIGGGGKVFILKFSNTGTLLWATLYGGDSGWENGYSICTDLFGNIFVTGVTLTFSLSDFPTYDPGGGAYFQPANGGRSNNYGDAFILKFSNTGVRLWATYYGGSGGDWGNSICTDPSGNVFITGYTVSSNFPTLAGGAYFQAAYAGSTDAFILKFSNAGVRQWATYYGGSGEERGYALSTDPSGNVFVTGLTTSADLPVLNPLGGTYFQPANAGGYDAFILSFDNGGVRKWATYYGGSADDWGQSVCTDLSGNVFVTGYTGSTNFPVWNPGGTAYFQAVNAGNRDAFILKFNNAGVRRWATYYGGSGNEGVQINLQFPFIISSWGNIDADGCGNVYVSISAGSGVPVQNSCSGGYYDPSSNGGGDIFIIKFSNTGGRLWATYFGGDGTDLRHALTVDKSDNLFITGEWCDGGTPANLTNASYPLTNPGGGVYYDGTHNGWDDGYIAKFIPFFPVLTVTATATPAGCSCTGTATASATGGCSPYHYAWYNSGGTQIGSAPAVSNLCAGNYQIIVKDTINCLIDTAFVTVNSSPGSLTLNMIQTNLLCKGDTNGAAAVVVSGGASPYTYSWFPSGGTTTAATGLTAGAYTVTVIDSNGCISNQIITITEPAALTVAISVTGVPCGNSNATATAGGGTPGYIYTWNPSGQTTQIATGLPAGTYTATVTDSSGCTQTQTVVITVSNTFTLSTSSTQTDCAVNNGTATAAPNGGTSPYTYSWNPGGQNLPTITGLGAGTYTVTVTDAAGCTQTQTITITSNSILILNTSSTQTGCTVNNGTATANPGNGTQPYTYTWSNGQTTSAVTGLGAGTYIVTVTDAGNCTQTQTVIVTTLPGPIVTANASPVNISAGDSTQLTATGGGIYSWSNGATGAVITVSPSLTTVYCVTVTDTNGCTAVACVTVIVALDCSGAGELYLPNAFSPNGDGENDLLNIYYGNIKCIREFKLVIYNRWGEKVFVSNDPSAQWDGSYKGKPLKTAVFVCYMKAALISGEEIIGKGNVSLLR